MFNKIPSNIRDYLILIAGSLLLVMGINLFIVPMGFYSGGLLGLAQISRTILVDYMGLKISFDIAGIINLLLNIPVLFMAYKYISKRFFNKTILVLILNTILFTLVKVPTQPIIDDYISACAIGGIITGVGSGLLLLAGSSSGGFDIIGIYMSSKNTNKSVGSILLVVNIIIYSICAYMFDIKIAIYSIIYAAIASIAMDRLHYQNIEINLMIFTKNMDVKFAIMQKYGRGVTYWNGIGTYTGEDTDVIVTICNKSEVARIKKDILTLDPKAFIVMNNTKVTGSFEKRLT